MDYSEYTSKTTRVEEYYVTVSDGVSLRAIDFIPKKDSDRKPVILFVAGWISLIAGWKGVMKEITPEFRTIYLETREKASSREPEGKKVSYTMDRLRDDILEAVEQLIPKKREYHIAGSSLGATAIMEFLALNRRVPRCAILIGPTPEFRFPPILGDLVMLLPPSLYLVIKPFIKWYLRTFRLDAKKEEEQVKKYGNTLDAADPYKLKANALALKEYKIWEKLPLIETPSLIIGAVSDTLHGVDSIKRMISMMPRAEYRELASNKETHSEKAGDLIARYIGKKEFLKI